jgi:hypothetical protein
MRLVRPSWLIVVAVIIITAAIPALRQQLLLGRKMLKAYQEDVVAFVEKRYPNDGEMLMAAGVLREDTDILKRAAETGNTPVAWAAYVERLMKDGPAFQRIGNCGVDPANTEGIREEEKRLAQSGIPDKLTPQQAEPLLSALRSWQEADAENALPVALEARSLYGLHRDKDTLVAWAQAGRMPTVSSRAAERGRALERLFVARGMPKPEAVLNSQTVLTFPSFARLRDAARFALYEGRLAAMRGDPVTAITWWQSTADFGRHMQGSADTIIGFLVGAAIHGIGANPVWQWVPDRVSGVPNGPLLGGRFFWGDYHSLHVEQMGERTDEELRDRLVLCRVRSQASRDYTRSLGMFDGYFNSSRHLSVAAIILCTAPILLLIFLAFGTWSRRAADEATNLQIGWQFAMAVLLLLPSAVTGLGFLRRDSSDTAPSSAVATELIVGFVAVVVLALILLPLFTAISSRAPGCRFRTAWRGNIRRILPVGIALSALLFLGISVHAARIRAQWAAKWSAPGVTEISDMIQSLGPAWSNPTIPADSWRAEYPPERPQ